MITFYKIVNGKAERGSGLELLSGYTEYTIGKEPQELIDAIAFKTPEEKQEKINNDSLAYLSSTDWYIIRFQEDGMVIPTAITKARLDARLAVEQIV